MATRSATFDRTVSDSNAAVLVTWTGLLNLDDGSPVQWVEYADRCFQLTGTLGVGGSVTLEGSNIGGVVAADWFPLADPQGNAVTKTALGGEQLLELPRYVRPKVTAGDGTTNLTVTICMRKAYQ
jgi:hypothetical protein